MDVMGYSLDAVIVYRGNKIGVEVDGPSHFVVAKKNADRFSTLVI
jgi:hypothetical protein